MMMVACFDEDVHMIFDDDGVWSAGSEVGGIERESGTSTDR
jgi:hypothetical protein